jgi:hypothetical protein
MSKHQIWEILDQEFENYPEDFGGSITDTEAIREAQKILDVNFSDSYINFLKKYGSAVLPGHIVYGLAPISIMGNFITNVIEKTKFYKENQKWPDINDWYIISDDGFGNPIGIDSKGKVWLSDHDSGFEQVKLADSFEEFLYKLHTDTLYQ